MVIAKDPPPDLQQAVLELNGVADGGEPLLSKSWDGHASDTKVFQERAQTLLTDLENSPSPRTWWQTAHATIQRMPARASAAVYPPPSQHLKVVSQGMTPALAIDTWQRCRGAEALSVP